MPDFQSIHTAYGLQRMAAAEAAGEPINITEIAVGDGNGNPVEITEDLTGLVRERFRAAVNRVYRDPERDNKYTAELVIPATEGGFTLREIGLFDDQGGLFVVGNLPETYKPVADEGAFADTIVRFEFLVTNASVVTLQIDPNVAVASQSWIINNITMASLLPGGTTGQVAKKASNADGDIVWGDPGEFNITVDTLEEVQTLAAGQTQIDLAVCTTRGLAVYIEGVRINLGAGLAEWAINPAEEDTSIILGKDWPAGTKVLMVQNNPAGSATPPLERDQNLADVPDKPLARANLGVYSKAESDLLCPPGTLAYWPDTTAPTGWLKRNGAAVSRVAYAKLFAVLGTRFGAGDGFNTFNLPDDRGEFIRGLDDGRGVDAERVVGTWQADELKSHSHPFRAAQAIGGYTDNGGAPDERVMVSETNTSATGGAETRPRNRAYLAIIKY